LTAVESLRGTPKLMNNFKVAPNLPGHLPVGSLAVMQISTVCCTNTPPQEKIHVLGQGWGNYNHSTQIG
jgi:hypothetical protein